jgi:hypothetical protein
MGQLRYSEPAIAPAMPCKTPGTVYDTNIDQDRIRLAVRMPVNLLVDITEDQKKQLVIDLHNAILPVIERAFQQHWQQMAGKTVKGDDRPMPDRWEDL